MYQAHFSKMKIRMQILHNLKQRPCYIQPHFSFKLHGIFKSRQNMIHLILVIVFLEWAIEENYNQVADLIGKDCSS